MPGHPPTGLPTSLRPLDRAIGTPRQPHGDRHETPLPQNFGASELQRAMAHSRFLLLCPGGHTLEYQSLRPRTKRTNFCASAITIGIGISSIKMYTKLSRRIKVTQQVIFQSPSRLCDLYSKLEITDCQHKGNVQPQLTRVHLTQAATILGHQRWRPLVRWRRLHIPPSSSRGPRMTYWHWMCPLSGHSGGGSTYPPCIRMPFFILAPQTAAWGSHVSPTKLTFGNGPSSVGCKNAGGSRH